jgi:hypothetical protein
LKHDDNSLVLIAKGLHTLCGKIRCPVCSERPRRVEHLPEGYDDSSLVTYDHFFNICWSSRSSSTEIKPRTTKRGKALKGTDFPGLRDVMKTDEGDKGFDVITMFKEEY